jgi:hypothetical protein
VDVTKECYCHPTLTSDCFANGYLNVWHDHNLVVSIGAKVCESAVCPPDYKLELTDGWLWGKFKILRKQT